MPDTVDRVQELIDLCAANAIRKLTLLVVPGLSWDRDGLDRLRRWTDAGYQLAGHGWMHRCRSIQGLRHRLHSLLLSRNVAEHLELSAAQCVALIDRCGDWFTRQGLSHHGLYVPPAWALGPVSITSLRQSPFSMIETLGGLTWTDNGRHVRLPLVGFEADTWVRQTIVRGSNAVNTWGASLTGRPLRIGLHPQDHRLRLAGGLRKCLAAGWEAIYYGELEQSLPTDRLREVSVR
jgi:predicted deacetylase